LQLRQSPTSAACRNCMLNEIYGFIAASSRKYCRLSFFPS
jgi:hypothetical protein